MAISLYELSQRISSSMSLGTIVPYYGTDEPSGWKICDGRSCAGSELAKKLGISNVPDLRGRFIRMIGGNAAGMAVAQGDCIRNITGQITSGDGIMFNAKASGCIKVAGSGSSLQNGRNTYNSGFTFDASRVVPTGPENRPINTAFNYIIKVNTNVILYYVSNIIYKAIAIGKSLLSRAKEEVRRTMAISLNNHEGRIAKLEKRELVSSYQETVLFDSANGTNNTSSDIKLSDAYDNYDKLIFRVFNDDHYSNGVIKYDINDIEFSTKGLITNDSAVNDNQSSGDYSLLHHGTSGFHGLFFRSNKRSIRITNRTSWAFLWKIIGVKFTKAILYSFSYIILYRLTQILFDSSLLGLFSQKGGARTI